MSLVIHTFPQGSPEWFSVRAGKPTASEFSTVLAKGEGKTRRAYLLKLAGEIITGLPMESYSNANMDRGKEQEDEARDRYAMLNDVEPVRVGFIEDTDLRCGASPDALIGERGVLELKSALPHILIDKLVRNEFPSEHKAQTQGGLWIAQRDWIDIGIHCRRLPMFEKRAYRDETYIATLASEVARFNDELAETVETVRRYGAPSTLKADLVASNILNAG